MSLIVDASVVIKWFVDEPLHEHARYLLKGEEPLHAPDLLLAEVGNIAWKKVIRGEIGEEHAKKIALNLHDLPVVLLPISGLIDRALQIALSIKHPVYDCLYLACAESLACSLITADGKLRRGLAGTPLAAICRHLENSFSISLSEDEIRTFIRQLKKAEETWKSLKSDDIEQHRSTPAFWRIKKAIHILSEAKQIDLLALSLLGRGSSGNDWSKLQEIVRKSLSLNSDNDPIYLVGLAAYIETGWRKFQRMAGIETKK